MDKSRAPRQSASQGVSDLINKFGGGFGARASQQLPSNSFRNEDNSIDVSSGATPRKKFDGIYTQRMQPRLAPPPRIKPKITPKPRSIPCETSKLQSEPNTSETVYPPMASERSYQPIKSQSDDPFSYTATHKPKIQLGDAIQCDNCSFINTRDVQQCVECGIPRTERWSKSPQEHNRDKVC